MDYSGVKALVVDDLDYIRNSVSSILEDMGMTEVLEAEDGAVAFNKVVEEYEKGSPFQVILCDMHMPNADGFDFLRQLRADERVAGVPVLMVSSESETAMIRRIIECGANNYLLKPFSTEVLEKKIEVLLK